MLERSSTTACSSCVQQNVPFSSFTTFSNYLDKLGLFRMRPGLDRMQTMLARLNLTRPPFTVAQIAGTNGKGSVSTMLASLAKEHGLITGLYTSPHFVSVRERVRVNDAMLSESEWCSLATIIMQAGGHDLSYFEFVTCLALLAFARWRVDLAVMETGLGGRFDATTAVEADMLLLTPIGLDHQAVLGNTLAEIAADKAGAIRPGKPVLSSVQPPEAWAKILHAAEHKNAFVRSVPRSFALPHQLNQGDCAMRLAGAHQEENARLALAGWRIMNDRRILNENTRAKVLATVAAAPAPSEKELSAKVCAMLEAKALARAWLPGRMQFVPALPFAASFFSPPAGAEQEEEKTPEGPVYAGPSPCALGWPALLLDGAHNSHGLSALGLALANMGIAPGAVIFSCLADKNPESLVAHLRMLATGPVFVSPIPENPRAMPAADLAALIGCSAVPVSSLQEALERSSRLLAERLPESFSTGPSKNPLLVCGSLYLLGAVYKLRPDCLKPPEHACME